MQSVPYNGYARCQRTYVYDGAHSSGISKAPLKGNTAANINKRKCHDITLHIHLLRASRVNQLPAFQLPFDPNA
jgi:hypothetical protein